MDLMTATPAMLPAQILLVRTTVLVTLDTWETERQVASQKVRRFTMSVKYQDSVVTREDDLGCHNIYN